MASASPISTRRGTFAKPPSTASSAVKPATPRTSACRCSGNASPATSRHFGVEYDPQTEVLVTVGVSDAIDLALRALLNPGDEVLYHEPCYVSYNPSIALAHGIPVAIPTRAEENFRLTADALAAKITPASKVPMLNFPCNPTGATQTSEELARIARLCIQHDLIVLTDEIYSELTYDGGEHSFHRRAAGHA